MQALATTLTKLLSNESNKYFAATGYTAPCQHYPRCGGCQLQHISYSEQIRLKEKYLQILFHRPVTIQPADSPFRYRNRMDFVTTFGKTGLHKRGTHRRIVDITHCHLISESANDILNKIKVLCKEYQIPDFDINRKEGFLKFVVLRMTQSGEIMVILITSSPDPVIEPRCKKMLERLIEITPIISGWWILSDELSDRTKTQKYYFTGKINITERIGPNKFHIGPETFFQNNIQMAHRCFETIKEFVIGEKVLDAYCGCGAISLYVHNNALSVTGVDRHGESIHTARENAELNGISNVTFIEANVENFLNESRDTFDTVIFDPPRSGLTKRIIQAVERIKPSRIIYMSCNPETQRRDVRHLTQYRLLEIRGFDMFPQTEHLETIAILERIK